VFTPGGVQIEAFDEMADLISRAVLRCRQKKIEKLLIDSTGVLGFHPPGIAERYNLAERIASDAASSVKIAHEEITVHEIPLAEVVKWLEAKATTGVLIDPKVYAGLFFVAQNK
jgi:hypothetical protein